MSCTHDHTLHHPEFVLLSVCHTTVGDERSPGELIRLAAAMQFFGFLGVIGSIMRSVDDGVAQQIVSAFCGNLVDGQEDWTTRMLR
ncbi:hypothetical protein DFJ58DRAFT_795309 [Suillus subalutaceus]|uniref:uncharacterized protein n=1 Tax=Suillus subalutaceus TaxID=48586 RepID=UPI001B8798E9|nr:uncharacterized protein DFJ58DRAFT_795309 [Suillus subalutaceus]KAG1849145.1 hypothetical protein DFJ58DRAFT_795309 [Suillus subalutaceus]